MPEPDHRNSDPRPGPGLYCAQSDRAAAPHILGFLKCKPWFPGFINKFVTTGWVS